MVPGGSRSRTRTSVKHPLLITVPALFLGTPVVTLLAPVLLPLALVVDLITARFRLPLVRMALFAYCYLWLTIVGVLWLAWLWLRTAGLRLRSAASLERHRVVQTWWVSKLMGAADTLLALRIDIEGREALDDGRAIVLCRHTSFLDAIATFVVVGLRAKKKARYVLKSDLLWEPALGIAGQRLPNHFVRRSSSTESELVALGRLGADLDHDEVVVIFPEGTFPAPHRRVKALARLEDRPELLARGEALQTLLPPRTGGTLRLLDSASDADVVLMGHVGFEQFSSVGRVLRSVPFRHPVRVRLWRCRRSEIPIDRSDRQRWLFGKWNEIDRWVTSELEKPERAA